jgi:sulfur relay (sulfurtransferase) DsrF/TusC family protein
MEQQEVHVQIKCLGVLDISWEIKKTYISLTTYKVYNLQTQTVMESINMVVDDNLKEFVKKNLDNIIEITE